MTTVSGTALHEDQATITILDPRDGSVAGTVREAGRAEVEQAVAAARRAQPGWAKRDAAERGGFLHAAADALQACAAELAALNARETGRPEDQALEGVLAGASTLRQYAELAPVHRGHSLRGGRLAADYTVAEPRGVAALLTPWNDPVAVAAGLLGAALATGNTVLHKPSERCPQLGQRLGEMLASVLPPDVLITLTGGPAVGEALTGLPGIDVYAHVGSSATGARIARAAAERGAHVVCENGGNDPLLVDDGVDPVWAAGQAALGAFANSGQICTSVERIYVHRAVADAFCEALVAEARQRNAGRLLGPLVDDRLRREVHGQVGEAIDGGAVAAEGGVLPDGPGSYYPATVLLGCTESMSVMQEETFGPVAPVRVVDSFEEGLELAAAGRYGLAATVLTADMEHAQRAIAGLDVGTVKVNAVFGGAPGGSAQPRRDSGHGFGYGPELLDEFVQVKVVHLGLPGGATR